MPSAPAAAPYSRSAPLGARAGIAACLAAPALIACGDDRYRNPPYYAWDDTAALGAFNIDQMAGDDPALLDAHPFGSHTRELDEAVAGRIRFVRSISGKPKP